MAAWCMYTQHYTLCFSAILSGTSLNLAKATLFVLDCTMCCHEMIQETNLKSAHQLKSSGHIWRPSVNVSYACSHACRYSINVTSKIDTIIVIILSLKYSKIRINAVLLNCSNRLSREIDGWHVVILSSVVCINMIGKNLCSRLNCFFFVST